MDREYLEVCPVTYHQLASHTREIWGWEIVVYLFLGGLVAGLMILSAGLELRRGKPSKHRGLQLMPFIALGLLSVGMLALLLDLHYKVHFFRFYLAFKPASPMSWGAWILLIIYPAGLLFGLGSLSEPERQRLRAFLVGNIGKLTEIVDWLWSLADRYRRELLWTNVAVGASLGIYTGLLLGTMVARIQWNSAVLGPLFLSSGLSTGAAFMLLFKPDKEEQKTLVRWDILAIAAELFFIGLMLISFMGGNSTAQLAGENLMGGKWTALFWTLVVMGGLVVPLIMEIVELRRHLSLTLLTPVLILMGGVALRAILLVAGQESCFCEMR